MTQKQKNIHVYKIGQKFIFKLEICQSDMRAPEPHFQLIYAPRQGNGVCTSKKLPLTSISEINWFHLEPPTTSWRGHKNHYKKSKQYVGKLYNQRSASLSIVQGLCLHTSKEHGLYLSNL